jgi:preprotein translocase SecE subunit
VKDKEQKATATMANGEEQRPSGRERGGISEPPKASRFQVHKPGEGYATRLGMMVVLMSYAGYACHHWYYNWVFLRDFLDGLFRAISLDFLTLWMYDSICGRIIASTGLVALAVAAFCTSYYYIYLKRLSAEFLIKTDGELAKVTWPKATPWLRADTQVWGATYVVLLVIAILTVYVFGIDMVLQWVAKWVFYGGQG